MDDKFRKMETMKNSIACVRQRRGWLPRLALVVAAMLAAAGLSAQSITNGLRSWYRFDGDARDNGGNWLREME